MDSMPYSEVRAQLAETLRRLASRDEAIVISRRGQPAAVLMSMTHYQRLSGGDGGFIAAMDAWRDRHAAALAEDAAEGSWADPFADVRDRRPVPPPAAFDDTPGDGSA